MGVNTTYMGHIEIEPPLNPAERDYLTAFAASRRSWRRAGPDAVEPRDPHTGSSDTAVDRYNRIAQGKPSLWCQWVPCPSGCCLSWDGHERFYAGPSWLQYLPVRPVRLRPPDGRRHRGSSRGHARAVPAPRRRFRAHPGGPAARGPDAMGRLVAPIVGRNRC